MTTNEILPHFFQTLPPDSAKLNTQKCKINYLPLCEEKKVSPIATRMLSDSTTPSKPQSKNLIKVDMSFLFEPIYVVVSSDTAFKRKGKKTHK